MWAECVERLYLMRCDESLTINFFSLRRVPEHQVEIETHLSGVVEF